MARDNFNSCLAHVLEFEGGWADNPADPGGATMKGITIATYRAWKGRAVTKAELRAIPDSEVAAIYRQNYWNPLRGDDLPAGLDLVAFDAGVNSGVSRGARWLQQAVGVASDGKIGPQTLAAAAIVDHPTAISRALDHRLAFMQAAKHSKTGALLWPTFGRGWQRRVDSVRAVAMAMAKPAPNRPSVPSSPSIPVTDAAPAAPEQPAMGATVPLVILGATIVAAAVIFGVL